MSPPQRTDILIIGGGPAGAYSGAALAREGFDVTIIEASKFPRYHVGESLLPSVNHFFRFIGAEERLRDYGFCVKPGAAVKLSQRKKEGYADFIKYDPSNHAYNVDRAEFDEFLLCYAAECGAKVFEETKATHVTLPDSSPENELFTPGCVRFTQSGDTTGEIRFNYLIDASGKAGILSTKYLKNRQMNKALRNVAMWGYWIVQRKYAEGTTRENAPLFECLKDGTGWVWFIPLQAGKVSVGVVTEANVRAKNKMDGSRLDKGGNYSTKDYYLDQLKLAPDVMELLTGAALNEPSNTPTVRLASDFSYAAEWHAGDHYRIVGDASSFIDPLFSSGVHLALLGGLSASISIAASIRKDCSEADAIAFHNKKMSNSYHRFLSVVTSAYAQLKRQEQDVLATPEEKNFDRSIRLFMPVTNGMSDVDFDRKNMKSLREAMEFCHKINSDIYQAYVTDAKVPSVYQGCLDTKDAPNLYHAYTGMNNASNVYQSCECVQNHSNFYQTCLDKNSNVYQACIDKENASNAPDIYQECAEHESFRNMYHTRSVEKDFTVYCAYAEKQSSLYQACVDKDSNVYHQIYSGVGSSNMYHACEKHSDLYQACVDKNSNAYQAYSAEARPSTSVNQAHVEEEIAADLYQAASETEKMRSLYHAFEEDDKAQIFYQSLSQAEKDRLRSFFNARTSSFDQADLATNLSEAFDQANATASGGDIYSGFEASFRTFYQAFASTAKPDLLHNLYNAFSSSVKSEFISNLYHLAIKATPTTSDSTDRSGTNNSYNGAASEKSGVHDLHDDGGLPFAPQDLLNDHVNGLIPRMEKGKLGLVCA